MADPLETRIEALLSTPAVARAREIVFGEDARTLRDQRELTAIPAPPFGEGARAERMAELMEEAGLLDVTRDEEGNVLARWGPAEDRPLVVSAHLDTVFPEGTDVTVREEEDRLLGPGISDDGRGLAALLALGRSLAAAGVRPDRPLLFAATVGEEGEGDLRGVRHLFREGGPARAAVGFVSLDGAGLGRIVTGGVGSRRFRLRARGAGGHSWVDWGMPNPIHALARTVAKCTAMALADDPRTTLSVGRWGGGTSVNAIPQEAWVELEVRSRSPEEIDRVADRVRELASTAVAEEDTAGRGGLELAIELIGDRPASETDPEQPLVRAALAATRAVGVVPELAISSTDANVPMALGIPAVTVGAGGEAGLAHTPQEWYRNEQGPEGVLRALLTLLAVAGVE